MIDRCFSSLTLKLTAMLALTLLFAGCSGDEDNISTSVTNNTDREVFIYYLSEEENDNANSGINESTTDTVKKITRIPSGENRRLAIKKNGIDGSFKAVYGGVVETFWVQSVITGYDSQDINTSDFTSIVVQ